ncbi:MAG: hypothetical protein HGA45_08595 [Chloroflexales bacterium]|nr:hypothetical protein [Chloroflexales bacterium]
MTTPTPDEPRIWLARGSLRLNVVCYERYFSGMHGLILLYEAEPGRLWVLPVRAERAGGFLLKQVNLRGDRAAVVQGFLRDHGLPEDLERSFTPCWDATRHGIALELGVVGHAQVTQEKVL